MTMLLPTTAAALPYLPGTRRVDQHGIGETYNNGESNSKPGKEFMWDKEYWGMANVLPADMSVWHTLNPRFSDLAKYYMRHAQWGETVTKRVLEQVEKQEKESAKVIADVYDRIRSKMAVKNLDVENKVFYENPFLQEQDRATDLLLRMNKTYDMKEAQDFDPAQKGAVVRQRARSGQRDDPLTSLAHWFKFHVAREALSGPDGSSGLVSNDVVKGGTAAQSGDFSSFLRQKPLTRVHSFRWRTPYLTENEINWTTMGQTLANMVANEAASAIAQTVAMSSITGLAAAAKLNAQMFFHAGDNNSELPEHGLWYAADEATQRPCREITDFAECKARWKEDEKHECKYQNLMKPGYEAGEVDLKGATPPKPKKLSAAEKKQGLDLETVQKEWERNQRRKQGHCSAVLCRDILDSGDCEAHAGNCVWTDTESADLGAQPELYRDWFIHSLNDEQKEQFSQAYREDVSNQLAGFGSDRPLAASALQTPRVCQEARRMVSLRRVVEENRLSSLISLAEQGDNPKISAATVGEQVKMSSELLKKARQLIRDQCPISYCEVRSAPERLRDDKRQYAEYLKYLMHINNSVVKQKKPKPGSQKTDEQPETGVPPPDDETAKDPEWLAEDTGLDLRKSFRDGIEFWNRPFIRQVAAILDGDTERNILLKKAETATKGIRQPHLKNARLRRIVKADPRFRENGIFYTKLFAIQGKDKPENMPNAEEEPEHVEGEQNQIVSDIESGKAPREDAEQDEEDPKTQEGKEDQVGGSSAGEKDTSSADATDTAEDAKADEVAGDDAKTDNADTSGKKDSSTPATSALETHREDATHSKDPLRSKAPAGSSALVRAFHDRSDALQRKKDKGNIRDHTSEVSSVKKITLRKMSNRDRLLHFRHHTGDRHKNPRSIAKKGADDPEQQLITPGNVTKIHVGHQVHLRKPPAFSTPDASSIWMNLGEAMKSSSSSAKPAAEIAHTKLPIKVTQFLDMPSRATSKHAKTTSFVKWRDYPYSYLEEGSENEEYISRVNPELHDDTKHGSYPCDMKPVHKIGQALDVNLAVFRQNAFKYLPVRLWLESKLVRNLSPTLEHMSERGAMMSSENDSFALVKHAQELYDKVGNVAGHAKIQLGKQLQQHEIPLGLYGRLVHETDRVLDAAKNYFLESYKCKDKNLQDPTSKIHPAASNFLETVASSTSRTPRASTSWGPQPSSSSNATSFYDLSSWSTPSSSWADHLLSSRSLFGSSSAAQTSSTCQQELKNPHSANKRKPSTRPTSFGGIAHYYPQTGQFRIGGDDQSTNFPYLEKRNRVDIKIYVDNSGVPGNPYSPFKPQKLSKKNLWLQQNEPLAFTRQEPVVEHPQGFPMRYEKRIIPSPEGEYLEGFFNDRRNKEFLGASFLSIDGCSQHSRNSQDAWYLEDTTSTKTNLFTTRRRNKSSILFHTVDNISTAFNNIVLPASSREAPPRFSHNLHSTSFTSAKFDPDYGTPLVDQVAYESQCSPNVEALYQDSELGAVGCPWHVPYGG